MIKPATSDLFLPTTGMVDTLKNMMIKSLAPFLVMVALLIGVVMITTASLNYKLKKRIIESGKVNEDNVKDILKWNGSQGMLKWCLLLFFGGLGLVVLEFIPFPSVQSPLPYGLELMFLALGFGIYYLIIRTDKNGKK